MKKTLLYTALTALLMGSVASVVAGEKCEGKRHHKGQKMFQRVDANGDGIISKSEHQSHAEKRFTHMDTNGDGQVTKEEAMSYRKKMKEEYREKNS